jgi:hypothetical protein
MIVIIHEAIAPIHKTVALPGCETYSLVRAVPSGASETHPQTGDDMFHGSAIRNRGSVPVDRNVD